MTSRLAQMQAKFQQKQIQEREEKLLRLYENQQQKAFERVNRGSAGSNTSLGSTAGGKVRQMFDERRQKAGIDKSYPLEPLKATKPNGQIRGGSVDRIKNTATKTVVKSAVQKTTTHVRNGNAITVNKQEVIDSVYNNNNGDEFYEEQTLRNEHFDKTFNKPHTDIIEMMNNHNLNDSLDNEEMPQLGFDEPDESIFTGKLANLGGKLPSETFVTATEQNTTKAVENSLGKTFRKKSMPIIKRTIRPALSPQNSAPSTSVQSQSSKTKSSPISSPARSSVSQTMKAVSKKTSPIKTGTPQPVQLAANTRASAKQSAKSSVVRDDLNECRYCNRRFAADRLELHASICGKTMKKKRKTYDATKHRVEGTDLEQYVKRGKLPSSKSTKQPPKKDWRRTHEEFINAIKAAKVAQAHVAKGGKLSDLPPPPPSSNPDYVQCPHCGRKFNEAAAERHIPKCVNYSFNKPKPGASSKGKISGRGGR